MSNILFWATDKSLISKGGNKLGTSLSFFRKLLQALLLSCSSGRILDHKPFFTLSVSLLIIHQRNFLSINSTCTRIHTPTKKCMGKFILAKDSWGKIASTLGSMPWEEAHWLQNLVNIQWKSIMQLVSISFGGYGLLACFWRTLNSLNNWLNFNV